MRSPSYPILPKGRGNGEDHCENRSGDFRYLGSSVELKSSQLRVPFPLSAGLCEGGVGVGHYLYSPNTFLNSSAISPNVQ